MAACLLAAGGIAYTGMQGGGTPAAASTETPAASEDHHADETATPEHTTTPASATPSLAVTASPTIRVTLATLRAMAPHLAQPAAPAATSRATNPTPRGAALAVPPSSTEPPPAGTPAPPDTPAPVPAVYVPWQWWCVAPWLPCDLWWSPPTPPVVQAPSPVPATPAVPDASVPTPPPLPATPAPVPPTEGAGSGGGGDSGTVPTEGP